ncbi:MAG: TonB-dependent receptor [Bacteroidales bacterium]|nr:TonB-dependent receptor [Bacteroidales bacterium]
MKKLLLFVGILISVTTYAQKNTATVSGYITDSASGETLIGAGVILEGRDGKIATGALTNVYGYYTLTIPKGRVELQYSYVGYGDIIRAFDLQRDTTINIVLTPSESIDAARVVVQKDAGIQSTYLGAIDVPILHIKNTPVLFGEADVLKAIQMMPGVQGGSEGMTGLYVRGGAADENLILLDGVPIYNVDHMLGVLSVFQTEAVKKVTLYKGSFPARYGGRVSSIVDIRTNDGNMKETKGSLGLGVLTDKFHIEGPILRDRLSYSISARGLHSLLYDPLIRLAGKAKLLQTDDGVESNAYANYYFYDLSGKLCWRLSDSDRFFLSTYNGRDQLGAKFSEREDINFMRTDMGMGWGNNVVSLRWNHIFGQRLFANTTLSYNSYRMLMDMGAREKIKDPTDPYDFRFRFDYNSGIRDWSGTIDFDFTPDPRHLIKFGTGYTYHTFMPRTSTAIVQESTTDGTSKDKYKFGEEKNYYGNELTAYFEDDMSLGDRLTFNPGLHISWFNTDRRNYFNLQPRVSAKYSFDAGVALKAGYARMAQYVHLLSSTQISLPMDLWVPITRHIKPVTSDQYSAGIYYDGMKGWEFSVEAYYKRMHNILEYKDGASVLVSTTGWEDKVEMGEGFARGLEFFIQKTSGKLNGWLSYTLAKSERLFPDGEINLGERFPYKYDRRHSLNLSLSYTFNPTWDISASWVFATGGTTTIPEGQTVVMDPQERVPYTEQQYRYRNNYRLPSSHHLNLAANHHKKLRKGAESVWTFGVYNVYNQMNPNLVYVTYVDKYNSSSGEYESQLMMEKVTMLPILPSLSYTYNF